ncbi:Rieske 2Fe-2S domain-containing protein [Mycolicibacterium moriokaense]|uniref:cholesterol 7-desaturase n=1 Tax=Mycolicibacterium moriokaense TaxID=39691 RepID=A0AAD1M907_9MYCO|nr:Rieske 2Fe-2S domain-containing protein [Mycolicibacterium moriokaense]MCV7041947.1 Rieske 2Fe-2S domain-containing protein [Mycolicibacterium moriokaense]BBX04713.1 (2Fe-2S)-binding protein [Mycolicibacterium moriokaense]
MIRQGWPHQSFPSGWFQIGWSADFAPGEVRSARYFGKDLVIARTESGTASVFDAYCPHLGAHIGLGGKIIGENLACPFHGWQFDSDGRNVLVPYSTKVSKCRLRSWAVAEVSGLMLMWHDPDGTGPTWDAHAVADRVPDVDARGAEYVAGYPDGARRWERVHVYPQMIVENITDPAHFHWVHHADWITRVENFSEDGPQFNVLHTMQFAPNEPSKWTLDIRTYGVGVMTGTFRREDEIQFVEVQATTPIDEEYSDVWGTIWMKAPDDGSAITDEMRGVIAMQHEQLERDFFIWENMRYVPAPPFAPEEAGPYRALRRWAGQFYSDN